MTAPVVYLVPHGEDGHFESRACGEWRAMLVVQAPRDRPMLARCGVWVGGGVGPDPPRART